MCGGSGMPAGVFVWVGLPARIPGSVVWGLPAAGSGGGRGARLCAVGLEVLCVCWLESEGLCAGLISGSRGVMYCLFKWFLIFYLVAQTYPQVS